MAYDGWVEFDGEELVNASRTVQLAESLGIDTVWIDPSSVSWIETALAGDDYDIIENAPWYDAGYPASAEFAGVLSLGFQGLDDSTLSSTVTEYITDGGRSNRPRNTTLSIVASVAIIASTERGAEFGKRWLDRRLRGARGERLFCDGSILRYSRYASADAPIAHRRDVSLTRGTSVTRKRRTDCSVTWLVTFTLTANDPFEYGESSTVLERVGVQPEYIGPADKVNLLPNPSFETNTTGWAALGAGSTITRVTGDKHHGVAGCEVVCPGTAAVEGIQIAGADIAVTGSTAYSAGQWVKFPVGKTIRAQLVDTVGGVGGTFSDVLATGNWQFVSVTRTTAAGTTAMDWRVYEPTETAAITFWVDEAILVQGSVLPDYFDGDSPPVYDSNTDTWSVHQWSGAPHASTSSLSEVTGTFVGGSLLDSQGSLAMVQESCPVWDYSPIFDPLYPALVPSPTAPDFYPDGWDIAEGMTFNRYWVKLNPMEPSGLAIVPVITLSGGATEARMVRVSIWSGTSDFDDQCDPLFTAIVSYLPAGVDLYIDGEQKVSYVWDGVSPIVRRADSLVYGTNAEPLLWTTFTNDDGLMVTLDLFIESGDESGGGDVEMALALVPKSD